MAKKKRRRRVPRNIVQKTDRELAETVLGKRVMKQVDREMATYHERHPALVETPSVTADS